MQHQRERGSTLKRTVLVVGGDRAQEVSVCHQAKVRVWGSWRTRQVMVAWCGAESQSVCSRTERRTLGKQS